MDIADWSLKLAQGHSESSSRKDVETRVHKINRNKVGRSHIMI